MPPDMSMSQSCQQLAILEGGATTGKSVRNTAVTENLLRYGPPDVAAGVAIFGLGVAALPMLASCRTGGETPLGVEEDAASVFAYGTHASGHDYGEAATLFTVDELRARLGPLDPARISAEMKSEVLEVVREASLVSQDNLKAEVQALQSWSEAAQAALNSLERRSAFAYLGLDMDAEPEAVHRSYKMRALAVHPDKGGSDEEFLNLQEMVGRLQESDVPGQDADKKGNFYQNLKEMMKQAKERQNRQEPEPTASSVPDVPEEIKLQQRRAALHERTFEVWDRAHAAHQQLNEIPTVKDQERKSFLLEPLYRLVDDIASNIKKLPKDAGVVVAGERLFCRLLRRGVDVLAAASLVDATATVAHVAMGFTGPLLNVVRASGPCPSLEKRCQLLLVALGAVPEAFSQFMNHVQQNLDNKSAAEWRGCNEAVTVAMQNQRRANDAARADHVSSNTTPHSLGPEKAAEADVNATTDSRHPVDKGSTSESIEKSSSDLLCQTCYTDTPEWRALRVFCVRNRFCVDFNRDAADERCKASDCSFKHACAICGEAQKGSRRFVHKYHGAWNCPSLSGWIASQGSS
jgi:hypothetical protein